MIIAEQTDHAILFTLTGAIVSLVGVIVWAVKFTLHKVFGRNGDGGAWGKFMESFEALRRDLKSNTEAVKSLEAKFMEKQAS